MRTLRLQPAQCFSLCLDAERHFSPNHSPLSKRRDPSDGTRTNTVVVHICTDCTKTAQVQCLHCSSMTCLDCAHQHVRMAAAEEQVNRAHQLLDERIGTLDQIAAEVRMRIDKEHDKLVQLIGSARDQCHRELAQAIERDKRELRDSGKTLGGMPAAEVADFIEYTAAKTEHWSPQNTSALFTVMSNTPRIRLRWHDRRNAYEELDF